MKRYIIKIIFLVSILMCIHVYSNAASDASIELECDSNSIEPNSEIQVKVKIKNQTIPISAFDAFLNYDEDIFEKVEQSDVTMQIDDNYIDTFNYSADTKKILMTFSECLNNIDTIITIKMKVKSDVIFTEDNNIQIYLSKISLYNVDTDDYLLEEVDSEKLALNGININKDPLYLSTTKYKIGENNIENYEEQDKYITRISPNTSIASFITNLRTNGNISVYNANGEEKTNLNELVKTGMILKVTKEDTPDKIIQLTTIVIGDVNGDGIVDITDLVKIRQQIQQIFNTNEKVKPFDEKQNKSGDINEDLFIDITDLVKIRRYVQKLETW